ncbi:MAG: site-2 protease family protein, partial [Planctomycetaceae bacterium]|nr:site-2 protease family protein [Planctomycetaceae bacterium]
MDDPARAEFFERETVEQMNDDRTGNEGYREVFDAEYRVLGDNPAGESANSDLGKHSANPPRIHYVRPLILFLLTVFSTFLAGGWEYAVPVMSILLFHEFGHYLQCRRYGVPSTLPYFIPMPLTPFGTMGAVIVQKSSVANRKQLFDIAISGPLAGLVLAIPALIWGLSKSSVEPIPLGKPYLRFGEPLLIQWVIHWKFGPIDPGYDTLLHPVAFAGWVGIFITALNLFPIGQLDGGHMLYCLLGRPARTISLWIWRAAVGWILYTLWRGT